MFVSQVKEIVYLVSTFGNLETIS